jgi:hypothetical protein
MARKKREKKSKINVKRNGKGYVSLKGKRLVK